MQAPAAPSDRNGLGPPEKRGPFIGIGLTHSLARHLAGGRPVVSLQPEDIPLAGLDVLDHALVGCLLLGGTMDGVDILAVLENSGFRGEVLVVAPTLPDAAMVERELAQLASKMRVRLVVV